MKHLFLTTLLFISSFVLNAQQFEGEVTYRIAYKNLPEEMQAFKAMLPKKTKLILKNHLSKMEQNMSLLMKMNIISNSKTNKTTVLMNMMGKKIAYEQEVEASEVSPFTITKKDDIKIIAGYKCHKAILKDTSGNEITYWYTDKLPSYNNKNLPNLQLEGFPMEYSLSQNDMNIKVSASKVEKKSVSDDEFKIPKGYEMKTQEEMEEIMKGMKL